VRIILRSANLSFFVHATLKILPRMQYPNNSYSINQHPIENYVVTMNKASQSWPNFISHPAHFGIVN